MRETPSGRANDAVSLGATLLRLAVLSLALTVSAALQSPAPAVKSTLFDAPALLRDLQMLSSDEMEGRRVGTRGSERARNYLVQRFTGIGLSPIGATYLHEFTMPAQGGSRPARTGVNVVGKIDGRQPRARVIVLSAHYDHEGIRNGRVFNGADDNASGTAALLTLAEYFRRNPPDHPLLVVAFDAEEAGLLGSRAFVRSPPIDRDTIALNINADMLGRDPSEELWVVGTARQPFLTPVVARVAQSAPVRLRIGHDEGSSGDNWIADSDQYSFLEAGIPALYVGVEDKAFHHQPTDDFETIAFDFYVRAVETLIGLVTEFDRRLDTLPHRLAR